MAACARGGPAARVYGKVIADHQWDGPLAILQRQAEYVLARSDLVRLDHHGTGEQRPRRDRAGGVVVRDLAGLVPRHITQAGAGPDLDLLHGPHRALLASPNLLGDLDPPPPFPPH